MAKPTPGQFVREVRQEMSKVTWASRRDTSISVLLVFIFCMIIGVYFMIIDKILSLGISWLFG
ncbi:MAG: preprotein translocase subunit SecE [Rhodospirillaceae bacterium]|nr:preprotein translocase subunit SecE [Rhodospirillaceae bacterium]